MTLLVTNLLQRPNLLMGTSGLTGGSNLLQVSNNLIPSGFIPGSPSGFALEDGSGIILLEDGSILLKES